MTNNTRTQHRKKIYGSRTVIIRGRKGGKYCGKINKNIKQNGK